MTVSVLFEGNLNPGEGNNFTDLCQEAFKITRAYDGCNSIDLTSNVEDKSNRVLTEIWDSKEHYERYVAFRIEDGTVEKITSMCREAPSIRIYDIVSV